MRNTSAVLTSTTGKLELDQWLKMSSLYPKHPTAPTTTTLPTTSQSARRVKALPATVTFMRGDVYGTIQHISRGPKRLVLVKMDRSGKHLSLQLAI